MPVGEALRLPCVVQFRAIVALARGGSSARTCAHSTSTASRSSPSRISFFAYGTLKFGVNVGAGSVDADAYAELVTGPGPGAGFAPQARGFNYDAASVTAIAKINFIAVPLPSYGVRVGLGDVDADGFAEIAATPGPGPSHPSLFLGYDYDGATVAAIPGFDVTPATTLFGGRVSVGEPAPDGREELLCGAGPDPTADSTVVAYRYPASQKLERIVSFMAFPAPALSYGVNVASGHYGY